MSSLTIAPHAIYPYFWTPITLKNHSLCISVVSFFLSYAGSGKFWPHIEGGSQNDSSLPLPMSAEELLASFSSLTIKKKKYIPIKTLIITLVIPEYEDFLSFSAVLRVEKI